MRLLPRWLSDRLHRSWDWQAEIQSHLQMRAEWSEQANGLPPEAAEADARRRFGSPLRALERAREVHIANWIDDLARDTGHALRVFRRAPSVSLAVIATMAVGIGAATAVFSIVDPLLFRPLPYLQGEQLVSLGLSGPIDANEFLMGVNYLDWRKDQSAFQGLTSMRPAGHCDLGERIPLRVHCIAVESNFLPLLGVKPLLGRTFTREEDRPHGPNAVMLSYGLWRSMFGGQASALGKTVNLDDQPVRIIGVLPADFLMPQAGEVDVLTPEQLDEAVARAPDATVFLRAFARLKWGISIEQAKEGLKPLFQQALQSVPKELRKEIHLVVRSVRDRQIYQAKLGSWMLLGVVCLLLLMVCTNIASLLLAEVAVRENELAMRAALGAGRGRLIRQSLTESLLLGLTGGALGCAASYGFLKSLVLLAPSGFLRLGEAHIDGRVLLFASALSILCAILFGVVPALDSPRPEALKGERGIGLRRTQVRNSLVAVQIGLSVVLLAGAMLFARSFRVLELQAVGFRPDHLISASIVLNSRRYADPARLNALYDELESRLSSIAGVTSFALSDTVPPAGGAHGRPFSNLLIAGHPPLPPEGGMVTFRYVTPSYFRTMDVPLIAGRGFTEADRAGPEAPLVLSRSLANKIFRKENPIGQRISLDGNETWSTVTGVAGDVKNNGVTVAAEPEYYKLRMRKSTQLGHAAVALFRTSLSLATLRTQVEKQVSSLDPGTPVEVTAMDERIRSLNDPPRFLTMMVGIFAAAGLLLAGVGLYGLMAFLVASRTREIGVRAALGATRRDIAVLIQKRAGMLVGLGVLTGIAGSLMLTHLVRTLLFGISPYDPISLGVPALVLTVVGLVAAWRPARVAAKIDPATALRVT